MKYDKKELVNFLFKLKESGIKFELVNNKLKIIDTKKNISDEIILELKENKEGIINFYKDDNEDDNEDKIEPTVRTKNIPLSFAQERLWFIDQYEHNASYNTPGAVKLIGLLDINVLEKTFLEIIRRHEVLRTNFVTSNNVTSQLVHEKSKFELEIVDQSHLPEEEANQKITELIEVESQKPFDLANDSLIRLVLYIINDEEHTLFLNIHHIISDGWSFSVFLEEISIVYKAFSENKPSPLPELEIQYADYAVWQREHIEGEVLNKQSEYWKNKLSNTAILDLPTDKTRPVEQTFNGTRLHFSLDKDISEKLNVFSKENEVTLFMTLLSAFNVLLNKYTGQDDICVGSPIANRTRIEIEPLIGFFVNTLALRSDLNGEISFVDLVKQVKQTTLDAYTNQDMPFEKVVDIVQAERNLSYSPLFQVMMVLQNSPLNEFSFGNLSLKPVEFEQAVSKFDLILNFTETAQGLVGRIEYNTDLFDKARVERMIGHFNVLARSIISNPTVTISELEILTSAEKHKLLVEWNNNEADYSKDKTIIDLFEEQVEKTPDNVAIVFENIKLTFKELNEKTNIVAHYLIDNYQIKKNKLVGILLPRSEKMIISILGILKTGGAYLPIDKEYPEGRIGIMIEDAAPVLVISSNNEGIYIDFEEILKCTQNVNNLGILIESYNLFHVMYTSGSTGKPKGIMMEHNGVMNFLTAFNRTILNNYSKYLNIALFASFSFDGSIQQIFSSVMAGHSLFIIPKEAKINIEKLLKFYIENDIEIADATPVVIGFLANQMEEFSNKLSIKEFVIAGEALLSETIKRFLSNFSSNNKPKITNAYGPTECCAKSSFYHVHEKDLIEPKILSIGKPIINAKFHIINKRQQLVPIGVPGELCISGNGLARGYLNQPQLANSKFVNNPFLEGEKMYLTGDIVRWMPDGNIKFIGRNDDQIKIRGFRIELGEIQSALNKLEAINTSVVVAKEDKTGNKRLVAYLVSSQHKEEGIELNIVQLREELSKTLPDYMIPSLFVKIKELPFTHNRKVDRKALPDPEDNLDTTKKYLAPQTDIEKRLVGIWQELLRVEKVGIHDNFFELGGYSLLATQVISQIRNEFNIELPLKTLFEKPVLVNLSEIIKKTKSEGEIAKIAIASRDIELPLSFAQERLWFLGMYKHDNSYNMIRAVKLIGKLDINILGNTFSEIIRRHEILRTNFVTINNVASQLIHQKSKFALKTVDQSHLPEKEANLIIRELIEIESKKPFDLANDSLIRLVLYKINKKEHTLFLNKHHIISDGWSFSVFLKEISILYKAFSENKPSLLPELEIQYADYAVWQREHFKGEILTKQSEYWKNKLSGIAILELPTVKTRPSEQTFNGASLYFSLDKDISEKLYAFSKENDVTLFMTLLSAFKVLLNKYTDQDDICVGTPIANRTRSEIEPLIGFFVNMLALRTDLGGDISFVDLLRQVKQTTLDAYDNQDMPFEKVVDIVQPERNLSYSPLFQVAMVLQNKPVSEFSFDELSLKPIEFESTISKFDLTLDFIETADGLVGGIEYNIDLFDKARIERMVGHFNVLFESITSNPSVTISELEILSSAEKHKLLVEWNDTEADYPSDKCIHQLFEEQVEKTPDNKAVVFENKQLTYRELNEKSNQLAHYLQSRGVKPDSLIGICVERSLEMIVGLLGILKAGGAYVPIDPDYPKERISFMLTDCQVNSILTSGETLNKISFDSLISNTSKQELPVITPMCKQIHSLDILPHPDRSLVDYSKYHQNIGLGMAMHTISIQATRGCPYKCSYCFKVWLNSHKVRSADDIFNEILNCYEAGVSRFVIIDDIFNFDVKNSRLLLEKIISSGIDIQLLFPSGLRGDILTYDYIDLLVKAGTVNICLALESASPRIQKLIRKNLNLERLKNNINYIVSKYPHVVTELNLMIGFPTETEEEALMTLEFLKEIKWIHFPNLFILKIYPNTDMYKTAIENGITDEQINSSMNLAFHELPETLPFSKSFVRKFRADFMNEYFLLKERFEYILKYQFLNFTKKEILQKYDNYFPAKVETLNDLMEITNIESTKLDALPFLKDNYREAPDFSLKIKKFFPEKPKRPDALKILFIDLSMLFSLKSKSILYTGYEAPLGLMYLLSYLNKEFEENINGKIIKSAVDFDNYNELKNIISEFKPDLIGLRTISIYKNFFHVSVSKIKHWFPQTPIIVGGPYATSDYVNMLQDRNIDLAVLGEGELKLSELIKKILENNKALPNEKILKEIKGLAFFEKQQKTNYLRNIIQLDELQEQLKNESAGNIKSTVKSNNLAYVIYTSGSTGRPKGVMIEHKSVVNLVSWFNDKYTISDNTSVLQFSNFTFDTSIEDFFGILSSGGEVHLVKKDILLDIERCRNYITSNLITILNCTPNFLNELLIGKSKLESINTIISGGERLDDILKDRILSLKYKLYNNYGPTESTVDSLSSICSIKQSVTLGTPINNTQIYIVNKNVKIQPIGISGELCISGDRLARGYLKRPDLTAKKFTHNPFSDNPNSRLYKTGDLVRYLPDGNIEFLGRIDNQVKIRGFRIELGEIEASINKIETIKDCVVVANDDANGNKRLVAYIVSGDELNVGKLKESLDKSLPDYMVPSIFVSLEKMPLTPNGKIDNKALPQPEGNIETINEYVAPRNNIEQKLAAIWTKVLGVEKVGVYDNFFELGGHSLMATKLISQIRSEFNIELPLKSIFDKPNLLSFSQIIENTKSESEITKITVASRDSNLPLSFAQERLWFIDQYDHNASYNMPGAVKLIGKLDINILEKTFSEIIRRHEVLRTNFITINNRPVQLINKESKLELKTVDLSDLHQDEVNQKIQSLIEIESQKTFDLAKDCLTRLILYKINDEEHTLFLNQHHIISDGWSFSVFFKEISILYNAFCENKPSTLPELEIQYADYAVWQREHIEGEVLTKQSEYWKNKLSGAPILELPTDNPRPIEQTFNGSCLHFTLGKEITKKLNSFSKENEATLFMGLLSVYNVLLYKYTGHGDISVGSPIANRTRSELEPLIGFFVNTLALRSDLSGDISVVELLKQIKQTTLDAYGNQDIPFEKVVDIVLQERNLSYSPLFQVTMALHNTPESKLYFGELSLKTVELDLLTSKFDLSLSFTENPDGLFGVIEYNTDLFNKDRIERMIGHFKVLLKSIISNPSINISELEILTSAEKHKLLVEWNNTEAGYPKDKCIHQLFEEQVTKTPKNVAVAFEDEELTYSELNKKSNQLAHYLQSKGVKPDALAGICVDRSLDVIVGLLGILKSGGTYMPIDSTYPQERITYMLDDADCEIVLTQEHLELPQTNAEIIYLDAHWDKIENEPAENVKSEVKSNNLAYVIYTSGSTGKPKGVMIEHCSLTNLNYWHINEFEVNEKSKATQLANLAFDAATWEIWNYLLSGSTLYFLGQDIVLDSYKLKEFIIKKEITHCFVPTQIGEELLLQDWNEDAKLKYLLVGGDRFVGNNTNKFRFSIINNYGPTENTVVTTSFVVNDFNLLPPIGKPINNTRIYITDSDLNLTPIGVVGELCIAGDGLARGYLKRPELTAEKFIKNPFSDDSDSRLYKTGDLVRYLPDGNIEFIGRIDNQVKIRGFRIELGEIESCLLQHAKIDSAIVITFENTTTETKEIAAYIKFNIERINRKGLSQQRVDRWLSLYDQNYTNIEFKNENDFTGWNSSYTGLPINEPQMAEWLESTVDLIKQFKPNSIFEIGCGTGLVLFKLARYCKEYYGIDFSKESVDYVKEIIEADKSKYKDVEVYQSNADNIKDIELKEIDTIIINSVVQYFPGLKYLEQVLIDSIEKIKDSGVIIIGDLRNYQLLEDFYRSTELFKLEDEKNLDELKQRVKNGIKNEQELLIDPQYFISLQKRFQRISHVDIRYKQGIYQTEMNKYRYNVILHINKKTTKNIDKIFDWDTEINMYKELQKVLKEESPDILSIDNVPNFYLEEDKKMAERMENDQVDIKELKLLLKNEKIEGFNAIFNSCPDNYSKEIVWNKKKYLCNILFVKKGIDASCVINQSQKFGHNEYIDYSNDTLKNGYVLESKNEIKKYMEEKLPEYMVPSYFVEIENIPLTPNGKLDKKMLPDPRTERILTTNEYEAPQTEIEKKLADIWQELLGVGKVGIKDDFFDLGGHSLLATQVISKIRTEFKIEISLKVLFENSTIKALSKKIDSSKLNNEAEIIVKTDKRNVGQNVFENNLVDNSESNIEEFNI